MYMNWLKDRGLRTRYTVYLLYVLHAQYCTVPYIRVRHSSPKNMHRFFLLESALTEWIRRITQYLQPEIILNCSIFYKIW